MKTLGFLAFNVTRRGAMVIVGSGTAILNDAFTIPDVYSFMESIEKDHRIVEAFALIIKQMKEEFIQMKELRRICYQFV